MKTYSSSVFSRSLLALSLGCALAVLPLSGVRAQDGTATPPATSDQAASAMSQPTGGVGTEGATRDNKTTKAKSAAKTTLTAKEKQFIHKAAAGNAAEVQMAELALKKTENAQIKEFAQMMITDHTAANKDLMQTASDDGLANLKAEPPTEEKTIYTKMTALSGTAFDDAYVKHAVKDHEGDVKEYKEEQGMAKDAGLKAYVDKTLPIIEGHLKSAKEMAASKEPAKS